MIRKWIGILLALLFITGSACAEHGVTSLTGTEYFPGEKDWTYCYEYSFPQLEADPQDVAALMVNDTLATILDEMLELTLPMFSHSEIMTREGQTLIRHSFEVTCNTDRIFSVLLIREEIRGEEVFVTVEGDTFDVGDDFPGEILTLRGLVRVGESSDQLGEALMPVLWEAYRDLQEKGIALDTVDEESFYELVSPTLDFCADSEENAVFFFQPSLMAVPYEKLYSVTFTPEELAALAEPYQETEQ